MLVLDPEYLLGPSSTTLHMNRGWRRSVPDNRQFTSTRPHTFVDTGTPFLVIIVNNEHYSLQTHRQSKRTHLLTIALNSSTISK